MYNQFDKISSKEFQTLYNKPKTLTFVPDKSESESKNMLLTEINRFEVYDFETNRGIAINKYLFSRIDENELVCLKSEHFPCFIVETNNDDFKIILDYRYDGEKGWFFEIVYKDSDYVIHYVSNKSEIYSLLENDAERLIEVYHESAREIFEKRCWSVIEKFYFHYTHTTETESQPFNSSCVFSITNYFLNNGENLYNVSDDEIIKALHQYNWELMKKNSKTEIDIF